MKRSLVLAAALALSVLTFSPGQAQEEMSATYLAGPGGRVSDHAVPAGIGGYNFPEGKKPVKLVVEDFIGRDFLVVACQNWGTAEEGDPICGDGGEPLLRFCSDGGEVKLTPDFTPEFSTTVFVLTADTGCDGQAFAGTITMTFR